MIVRGEGKSPTTSFTIYATRTIFDLTFFIIVTTLGLNIVVAILVDRFSELRSEKVSCIPMLNFAIHVSVINIILC